MSSFKTGLGIVIFTLGAGATLILGYKQYEFTSSPPIERLQLLWENDLDLLKGQNKLPQAWYDIREVRLIPATEQAKEWAKLINVPIKLNPKGQHELDALLLTWEEDDTLGAVVQYSLIESQSKNMIWELGRTYILRGDPNIERFNKKRSEPAK